MLGAVLLVFTGCTAEQEYDYLDEEWEQTQQTAGVRVTDTEYKEAIHLMMKTFCNDFTEEELERMYPAQCWTYFEEENGKTLSQIYEDFSGRLAESWEKTMEEYGQDAAVRYEFEQREDCIGEDYEALKSALIEKYGFDDSVFGICYEVRIKKATIGSLKENIYSQWYHVIEIDGQWYVADVLTNMPLI